MLRRNFIKITALGATAFGFGGLSASSKTHILTLSWDDGFKKSFFQTADIFEKFGLKACLNVIASAHLNQFDAPNEYHKNKVGDFNDWNALKKRGHEIMPHSWEHQNLTQIPFDNAKKLINMCLNYFEENLEGYKNSEAVYNFAYNASNKELDEYVLTKVKAVRTGGWDILGQTPANPFPGSDSSGRLGCWSFGPENADKWTKEQINSFLRTNGGWLILNLHGLDEEGWGPVGSKFLENLLKQLIEIEYLDILPTGEVLKKYAS